MLTPYVTVGSHKGRATRGESYISYFPFKVGFIQVNYFWFSWVVVDNTRYFVAND